jgi:hypothetical protein
MNIELVGVADIDKLWPRVAGDITRCLRKAPTDVGAGDVWANCRSGQWFMIVAHDDVAIHGTTVWRFANGYFECLVLAGSDLSRWLYDLVETATSLAKLNGCRGLIATGRAGFKTLFKKHLPQAKAIRVTHALEFGPCLHQ